MIERAPQKSQCISGSTSVVSAPTTAATACLRHCQPVRLVVTDYSPSFITCFRNFSRVGRSRGRVGISAHKGMAAPVHRFAALDPPPPRRIPRSHRNHTPPQIPAVHAAPRRVDPSLAEPPPQPTIASLAAARSVTPDTLLRTAALGLHHHSPVMAPHLKFGMLVSFALATVFLAGTKYYFDRQVVRDTPSSGGGGAVVAVAAALAGAGCALSACRSRSPPLQEPDRVTSTAQRHRETPPEPPEQLPLTISTVESPPSPARSEAPPPYHIAVLLPRAAPPPAYNACS